jgi:predicted RNA binding protein YcfA (HicA-like mRNA interferase family)
MGRLKRLTTAEICAILEQHGFERVRQRGSHVIMRRSSPDGNRTVPVPYRRKELQTGTMLSIIELSGLPRELFEQ